MGGRLFAVVVVAALSLAVAPTAGAYEIYPKGDGSPATIAPAITEQPIDVREWVQPGVTPANEAWVRGKIQTALDMYQNVPTSELRFTTSVVHSAGTPQKSDPRQLLIIIGNGADLTGGGAYGPQDGYPGTWLGAVADYPPGMNRDNFEVVAAHEIGHALDFGHSSVGKNYFGLNNLPVMHWVFLGNWGLTADDAAAASVAYPQPGVPLSSTSGKLSGRVVEQGNNLPIDYVNLVAVNTATGKPAVGRLSGTEQDSDGAFHLAGLPPGTYNLQMLDGQSFAGTGDPSGTQTDNFDYRTLGPYTLSAGQTTNLGDLALQIKPIAIDSGFAPGVPDYDYRYDTLPDATAGSPYVTATYQLGGGVRPLTVESSSGLPAGMTATIDTSIPNSGAIRGRAKLLISGTPTESGPVRPVVTLRDAHGNHGTLKLPTLAERATVRVPFGSSFLRYKSGTGNDDDVTVSLDGSAYTLTGSGAIKPGSGCSQGGSLNEVRCPKTTDFGTITSMAAELGDGNDRIRINAAINANLKGGDGNDELRGGPGIDEFDGGTGADDLHGGDGHDYAYYDQRTQSLGIDLDGIADDGEAGERDNVWPDIESIFGGSGNDRITGSQGSNHLYGNAGRDKIYGYRSGSRNSGDLGDTLAGGEGDDRLYGQLGDDQLYGNEGNDRLYGSYGANGLFAGGGSNRVYGGPDSDTIVSEFGGADRIDSSKGDDTVLAGDGDALDSVKCGSGLMDVFSIDADEFASGCELPAPPPPPDPPDE